MPPGRRTSRSSATSRGRTRARSSAARNRARAASRARSRARSAAARRRDAARPSVRRSRAASTARSSRSGARTGSRTGGTSAAARRRDAARPSVRRAAAASAARSSRSAARTGSRTGGTSAAARRRDAARPSVARSRQRRALSRSAGERGRGAPTRAQAAARNRMIRANQTPARTSTASLSERRNAASAKLARQRAQTLAADRRRRQRQATGQANQRAGMYRNIRSGKSKSNANQEAAQSLLGAGYRNLAGDPNRSTFGQQVMSGIRNLARGELGFVFPGSGGKRNPSVDDFKRRRRRKKGGGDDQVIPPKPREEVDPYDVPPEIVEEFPPVIPRPQYPEMGGGLGGFGYSPALMAYESQQGAGQVPYYMAAARNAMTPNMSPAFMHAARNYDILGGSQRTRARPIEMMSARERAEIMNMGSNFNVPNYNSPYPQNQGARDFDYFRKMVSSGGAGQPADYAPVADMFPGGPPARFGGPGKGAPRPMPQDQARAMGGGLGSLMRSGMMGMF